MLEILFLNFYFYHSFSYDLLFGMDWAIQLPDLLFHLFYESKYIDITMRFVLVRSFTTRVLTSVIQLFLESSKLFAFPAIFFLDFLEKF